MTEPLAGGFRFGVSMKRFRLIEECSPTFDRDKQPEQWEADRVDYLDCVRQCMRRPLNPNAGADYEEMEKALRVLKALDGLKLGDILELEDEDHKNLAERARTHRWAVNDERVVRFVKTILNATSTVIDEPPQPEGEHHAPAERLDGHRRKVRA